MKIPGFEDFNVWRKYAFEELADREVVVSVSGGKDSTAMVLLLKEAGIPYHPVYMDTGWDHPATHTYLFDYLQPIIGEVKVLRNPKGGMRDLVEQRLQFPSRVVRYCTGELKLEPVRKYIRSLEDEIVNAVGVRAQESARRANYPEWEYSPELKSDVWRPIIKWTEDDVIEMHRRHDVRPNPLYLLGSNRVGCWPCLFASKSALRILAREDPKRVDEIREFEHHINHLRQEKDPNAPLVSWFSRGGEYSPIDKVIDWAFTSRTGEEMFSANDREAGCMRWGLCEMQHPIDKQDSIVGKA